MAKCGLEADVYKRYTRRMSKTAVVTARVDAETLASLDRLAAGQERSRGWIVSKAISSYVREVEAFDAWIKESEDQIDRGEFYTQEEMEEWARSLEREEDR